MTLSLEEIVEGGLCIGCGLCQSIAGSEQVRMVMTADGRERPASVTPLGADVVQRINAVCPGTKVSGADPETLSGDASIDMVWGPASRIVIGHASDPETRYHGASGGVLTALAQHLLKVGEVDFVLHVAASADRPMRSVRQITFDQVEVLEAAGSRYGPAAPLVDFCDVLEWGRPFALIGKPCDIAAVRNLARLDPRVDRHMRYALSLVCGGVSDLVKSQEVLDALGLREDEVALFRYRGFGNPGPLRIETKSGRSAEIAYNDMWADEAGWRIQSRCKICPDAIGEAADIVASDVWPGGSPEGEDDGFNGIIVRTRRGGELFDAAVEAGALTVVRAAGFRDLDLYQPHQVRKKRAVWARLVGLHAAGRPVPHVDRLRLEENARFNSPRDNLAEARGTRRRAKEGRMAEPAPKP